MSMPVIRLIALNRADLALFLRNAMGSDALQAFAADARAELAGGGTFYRLVRHNGVEFDLWIRPDTERGAQTGTDAEGNPIYAYTRRGWQVDIRFRNRPDVAKALARRIAKSTNTLPWRRRRDGVAMSLRKFSRLGMIQPATPDVEYREWTAPDIVPPDQFPGAPI